MSGCTLIFARASAVRTTLIDEATGHVKYKIETPVRIARSVTHIRKLESDIPHDWDEEFDSDSDDDLTDKKDEKAKPQSEKEERNEITELSEMPGMSDEMARVYWNWFSSDRIIFRGRITTRSEFLPACGKLKGSFTFAGPDGVHYRWALGQSGMAFPRLVTYGDQKEKVIAEFHCANHVFDKRKAELVIKPEGMHMLDYIILTFVVVEQTRRKREVIILGYPF